LNDNRQLVLKNSIDREKQRERERERERERQIETLDFALINVTLAN